MSDQTEGTRSVVVERFFPHAPEKLWRALTESPLLAEWLMKNDFEPAVGRRFRFRSQAVGGWDGVIDCAVQVVDPLKQLAYSWSALGLDSVVLFTVIPGEGGTHLRVEQSGFRPDQQAAYQGATYGWKRFFDGLERVLDGVA